MPRACLIVWASRPAPSLNAQLIFHSSPRPAIGTHRSRGMLSRGTVLRIAAQDHDRVAAGAPVDIEEQAGVVGLRVDAIAGIRADDEEVLGRAFVGGEHVGERVDTLDARFLAFGGEVDTGPATDPDRDGEDGGHRQRGAVNAAFANHWPARLPRRSHAQSVTPSQHGSRPTATRRCMTSATSRRCAVPAASTTTSWPSSASGGDAEEVTGRQLDPDPLAERRELCR